MTQICVSKLAIIGSDNGLSPGRRQAIIWINAGILLIGSLGTNFSEILMEIYKFSFKKMHLKMSSGKWRLSCLGLNVLMTHICVTRPQWVKYSRVQMPYDIICNSSNYCALAHKTFYCPRKPVRLNNLISSTLVVLNVFQEVWKHICTVFSYINTGILLAVKVIIHARQGHTYLPQ